MPTTTQESLDPPLQRHVDTLRRLWWIPILTCLATVVLGTLLLGDSSEDRSVASAVVSVSNPTTLASDSEVSISLAIPNLAAEAARAESDSVASFERGPDTDLAVSSDTGAGTLEFEVNGPADESAGHLDTWIEAYRADRGERLTNQVAPLETALRASREQLVADSGADASLAAIDAALASVAAVRESPDAGAVVLDLVDAEEKSSAALTTILLALFGGALGIGIIVVMTLRDRTARTAGDLVRVGAGPVIGTLAADGSGNVGAVIGSAIDADDAVIVIAGVDAHAADGAHSLARSTAAALGANGSPVPVHDLDADQTDITTITGPAVIAAGRLVDHSAILLIDGAHVALCAEHARSDRLAAAIAAADVANAGRSLLGIVLTGVTAEEQISVLSH